MVRFFTVCALLLAIRAHVVAADAPKPNVVLILMDDLGRNDVGCYGSTYHRTPHRLRATPAGAG